MALFAAPAAHAADSTRWSRIASSREDLVDFYVDRANVAGGRTRTVRLLYDYRDVQQDPDTLAEHRSSIVTARFDCRSHTMGMVSIENFAKRMGRGARSGRQLQRAEMRPIAAGTIDDRIQKVVCGR